MFSRFLLTLVLFGLVNSAAIGRDHRQTFAAVRVDRAEVAIAVRALERRGAFHNFNYSLANDVLQGVKKVHLDAAADLVCSKLDLIDRDCDSVRNSFKILAFVDFSKLEEFSLDQGEFKSIFGFITGVRNSQGDVDIAYTVHQQEFTVENMYPLTREEVVAIKMHYFRHVALLNLKQENIIQSISYV